MAIATPQARGGQPSTVLSPSETARLLRDDHGVTDAELAHVVHGLTGGWPILVGLAGEALTSHRADHRDLLAALTGPTTAGARWIREQLLADLPPHVGRLLNAVADLDPITGELCTALAGARPGRTVDAWGRLIRSGLVTLHPQRIRTTDAYRLVPAVAAVLREQRAASRTTDNARNRPAADWYERSGFPLAAARTFAGAGDTARCAALIENRGDEMLAVGGAAEVVRVGAQLPAADRTPDVMLILADAARMAGDVVGAERAFAPLVATATRAGRWAPRLAWRVAMLRYMRGDHRGALDMLDRAERHGPPTADDVQLAACRATVLVVLGDPAGAAAGAAEALAGAVDDRSAAAAHLCAAFTTTGVRRDAHLADALAAAERAGDVVIEARILLNQADCLLREASYPRALDVAARAVRAAEAGAPPGMLVMALHNAGEALGRLGRYDEAIFHFERSMRISRRIGLDRTAAGLYGLGEVNRLLGRREQSRAAFEEAAELARASAELQVLVPVLARLSQVLLDGAGADPVAARAAADEAVRVATPELAPSALAAQGWVALSDGDLETARARATDAVRAARAGRQAHLLAETLELAAAVSAQAGPAREALQEAAAIWQRAGALPAADRLLVLLGRVPGADGSQRLAGRAATERLLALGVQVVGGSRLVPDEAPAGTVRVLVLGRFDVLVGGRPVPLPAWRSRQARTLVKILVARRGRPVARTELCELLWPDDDPQRTAHRLSVLLSAVRAVLDPARRLPADHYLRADSAGVSLDYSRVTVDAEDLLRDSAHAVVLARSGDTERAVAMLGEVDRAYTGEALDDEPYEHWADALREQVRAAWLGALRELAQLSRSARELDQAATSLVRLLAVDPYDESAHGALVDVLQRSGRRGEARRAYDRWVAAMRSLDAPVPDRGVLNGAVTAGRRQQGYSSAGS
jgi:DNA-binding SARP family transcriptional activator/tetratricopeptide (TPR) repeat protein